jgi:hypothetical protein
MNMSRLKHEESHERGSRQQSDEGHGNRASGILIVRAGRRRGTARAGRTTRSRTRGVSTGGVGLAASQDIQADAGDLLAVVAVDLLRDGPTLDIDEFAGLGVGEAVVDEPLDAGGPLGQIEGVGEGGVGDEGGVAFGGLDGGLGGVGGLDAGHVELGVLGHEVVVVDEEGGGAVVVELDETVVVFLLGPFVDETAREGLGHFWAVEGLYFGEDAGLDCVAAVLGEEDGDGGVAEVLGKDVVAALGVGGVAAPRVGVEAEEVRAGVLAVLADEVVEGVHEDGTDIGSRVPNRDGTVNVLCDVILHVTLNCLQKCQRKDNRRM